MQITNVIYKVALHLINSLLVDFADKNYHCPDVRFIASCTISCRGSISCLFEANKVGVCCVVKYGEQ